MLILFSRNFFYQLFSPGFCFNGTLSCTHGFGVSTIGVSSFGTMSSTGVIFVGFATEIQTDKTFLLNDYQRGGMFFFPRLTDWKNFESVK